MIICIRTTYLIPGHPDGPYSTNIYNISQWRRVLAMQTQMLTIDPSIPKHHESITKWQTFNKLSVVAELVHIVLALSMALEPNHLFFIPSVSGDVHCDNLQTTGTRLCHRHILLPQCCPLLFQLGERAHLVNAVPMSDMAWKYLAIQISKR